MNWKEIYSHARQLLQQGQPIESLRYGLAALQYIGPKEERESIQLYDLIIDAGIHSEQYSFVEEALPVVLQLKKKYMGVNSLEYASGLNNMGFVYYKQEKYAESIPFFEGCLTIYAHQGRQLSNHYIQTLYTLAITHEQLSQFDRAVPILEECAQLTREWVGEEHDQYIRTLYKLARIYHQRGVFAQASQLLSQVVEVNARNFGKQALAYLDPMQTYARVLQDMGAYDQAENLLLEGKYIIEESHGTENEDYAMLTHNLGECWLNLGRYQQAEKILETSVKLKKQFYGELHQEYANTLNNLGIAYKHTSKADEAEEAFEEVRRIYLQTIGGENSHYTDFLSNLGYLYLELGKYDKAVKVLLECLEKDEQLRGKKHPVVANTLSLLGQLSSMLQRYELAQVYYLKSLEIYLDIQQVNPKFVSAVAYNYATMLKNGLKDFEQAQTYYKLGLTQYIDFIQAQLPALSEQEKLPLINTYHSMLNGYAGFVVACLDTHPERAQALYEYYLVLKGILSYSTQHMRKTISQLGDSELDKDFEKWLMIKRKLANAYKQAVLPDDMGLWEEEANQLERKLSQHSHEFVRNQALTEVNWKKIREALSPHEAAIETFRVSYVDSNKGEVMIDYLFWGILPSQYEQTYPTLIRIPEGEKLENSHLKQYQLSLLSQDPLKDTQRILLFDREEDQSTQNDTQQLFEVFWKPIHAFYTAYAAVNKLYFSPDGVYHLINAETFSIPAKGTYTGDLIDMHLLISTRDIIYIHTYASQVKNNRKAVLLGAPDFEYKETKYLESVVNDQILSDSLRWVDALRDKKIPSLPGTKQEVEEIGILLQEHNWECEILMGGKASVDQLWSIERPVVLHLATHGYFSQRNDKTIQGDTHELVFLEDEHTHIQYGSQHPLLRSGLLLAGAQQMSGTSSDSDSETLTGIFSAYDAAHLDLSGTELVVLSACETAVGQVQYGEGIHGLQRAFFQAGAKTLICSLWRVSDMATRELMTAFYRYWLSGNEVRKAFSMAQKELRNQYPDPFYWGAFIVLGS